MLNASLQSGLLAIYRDLENDVAEAGARCDLSGRCCRFGEFGHTLFVSSIEAELLVSQPRPRGPLSEDFCPYQRGALCTARNVRPLGCRVYFCDAAYRDRMEELSELYVKRIKDLADEQGREWHYGPLHRVLESMPTIGIDSTPCYS